jgi:hypothetical protein
MADELLEFVKSIDARTQRMETAITTTMQKHQDDDDDKHEKLDVRIKSLETSRTAARAGLVALTVGGGGGAVKLGFLDKVISIFGGGQ